jgi:4-methyl-5(b-hydroxyethyl)-thiazole monophosphate biosynthesis
VSRVLVPLAEGFEEIEAVTVIDLLRRAGIEVVTAGLESKHVTGSHGIAVTGDTTAGEVDAGAFDALVLPGGPGTRHLHESARVREWVESFHRSGRLLAAICAAPTVLEAAGVLAGRPATSHPAHAHAMRACDYRTDAVVRDGNVITSRGAGTAIAFAAAVVSALSGEERAADVLARIVYTPPQ